MFYIIFHERNIGLISLIINQYDQNSKNY